MEKLSDGFIAFPGGIGTLDELCEILAWVQLGVHSKPVGICNIRGYFDPLIKMFETAVEQGFFQSRFLQSVVISDDSGDLLEKMEHAAAVEPLLMWKGRKP